MTKINRFQHSVALDALSLTSVVTPLLHHYRAGLEHTILANRMQLDLTLSYRANPSEAWCAVPADGQVGFMKPAIRVSMQIQRSLRCWLEMFWFAGADNFSDTHRAAQVLGYLACRPYFPKAKNNYAYDLLDDWSTKSIERSVRAELPESLTRASGMLRILGHHDLADFYDPAHAKWFAAEIERDGQFFFDLLGREARIIKAWVPYIGAPMNPARLAASRHETAMALSGILHRGDSLAALAPVFEIEAVAALDLYIGRPSSRSLTLTGNPERNPEAVALLCGESPRNVRSFPVKPRLSQQVSGLVVPFPLIDAEKAA